MWSKGKWLAVGGIVAVVLAAILIWLIQSYGAAQYKAGHAKALSEVAEAQKTYEGKTNGKIDDATGVAEANRKETQAKGADIGTLERDVRERDARIVGLLNVIAHSSESKGASGMDDGERAKWIGLFGSCRARAESLSIRYGEMGRDATNLADQVNGLQGYIRALSD